MQGEGLGTHILVSTLKIFEEPCMLRFTLKRPHRLWRVAPSSLF